MNLIEYKNKKYPEYETQGNAAKFIMPFAKEVLKDKLIGYDIGCNKLEWAYQGAMPIDINFNDGFNAYNLPFNNVDYIFSSHCLEHLENWSKALDYWIRKLNKGGILLLYLPHFSQEYWRSWNNKKHIHNLNAEVLTEYFMQYDNIIDYIHITGCDLNHSFSVLVKFKD